MMPVLECETSLSNITGRLRHLLDTIAPPADNRVAQTRVVTPEEMSDLLSWLMRAGQWLRSQPVDQRIQPREITDYRTEVQRLHGLLPSIHESLLAEHGRLEQERERVRSAGEWMQRSRQTL
jgi:hypothetical protein